MDLINILACPDCHLKLKQKDKVLVCSNCHSIYQLKDNILNLLPKNYSHVPKIEEQFWNYTYRQEGERTLNERSTDFHWHFRKPLIDLPVNSLVLEIGCGNRADTLEVAQADKTVIATDLSLIALQLAQNLAEKMKVTNHMHFIRAEAEHLPFLDNSFSGVLIAASLHHLPNPLAGLLEMKRVTKNGGYIILGVEPNSWPYKTIYKLLKPLKKYIRHRRQRPIDSISDDTTNGFSEGMLKKLFQEARIEIIEIRPVKYFLEIYDSYLRLKQSLVHKQNHPSKHIKKIFIKIDSFIMHIPVIKKLSWHWNVISRVKK